MYKKRKDRCWYLAWQLSFKKAKREWIIFFGELPSVTSCHDQHAHYKEQFKPNTCGQNCFCFSCKKKKSVTLLSSHTRGQTGMVHRFFCMNKTPLKNWQDTSQLGANLLFMNREQLCKKDKICGICSDITTSCMVSKTVVHLRESQDIKCPYSTEHVCSL